jgi:hypothetical protein
MRKFNAGAEMMNKQHAAFFRPAFIVCLILLAASAATKSIVIKTLGVHLTKLPIPLKKPLDQLDEKKLAPFVVKNKQSISNQDIVESLGTEQYLDWTLEDKNQAPESSTRYCSLFITYYTGNPDMVPHVPDECYVGGGNTRLKGDTLTTTIAWPGQKKPVTLSYQTVLFGRKQDTFLQAENQFSVQYFFKANGEFCQDRTRTRTVLGSNFLGKYSYFAKIEWKFFGANSTFPTQQQTLAATENLLTVILPVLEDDHWPDWEQANRSDVK